VAADETPTDPSANDLDLGLPTACQIGSTVLLPKNPQKKKAEPKKQTLEKLITTNESMKLATTL
jgi:hypothetical protein